MSLRYANPLVEKHVERIRSWAFNVGLLEKFEAHLDYLATWGTPGTRCTVFKSFLGADVDLAFVWEEQILVDVYEPIINGELIYSPHNRDWSVNT